MFLNQNVRRLVSLSTGPATLGADFDTVAAWGVP